jgi:hypothetical protein
MVFKGILGRGPKRIFVSKSMKWQKVEEYLKIRNSIIFSTAKYRLLKLSDHCG